MDRRSFLKAVSFGIAGLTTSPFAATKRAHAKHSLSDDFVAVLVDTTRCIGCRSCEEACAEAHHLPIPDVSDDSVFKKRRQISTSQLTVVNRYRTEKGDVFVKKQCMHCNEPACAAACLVKAMQKRKEGPVTWQDNCMGCRICMVSCPFDIPKFEYNSWNPRIQKCDFCWERLMRGEEPACVEACPQEALVFGKRKELIEEAKRRIYQNPDKYYHHIYGEHEVGGTGWLYISAVPFEQIGFKTDVGTTAYPEYTKSFLYAEPIILILLPAFFTVIASLAKAEEE